MLIFIWQEPRIQYYKLTGINQVCIHSLLSGVRTLH